MSGTVEDVIRITEEELGNTNGAKYFEYFGYGDAGDWCMASAMYCVYKGGASLDWPPADEPWKRFVVPDKHDCPPRKWLTPQQIVRGALVLFDWDDDTWGDHVGICLSKHDWGCVTREGNTGTPPAYRERQRLWSEILGGMMPNYTYRAKDEWIKADDGRWWYRHSDGSYTTSGWEHIDGEWYYFDAEGWMVTGWVEWGGWWYYLSEWTGGVAAPEGHMVKGGIFADKTGGCYAFYGDGRMVQAGDVTATPSQTHDGTFGRLVTA